MLARQPNIDNNVRGIKLGQYVLTCCLKLFYNRREKGKVPGIHFPRYYKIVVPESDEWNESVRKMLFFSLAFFEVDESATSKEKKNYIYKETLNGWLKTIPNAG